MKKRILSILLTLVMVIGMLPTVAFAAGTESSPVYVTNFAQLKAELEKDEDSYIVVNEFEMNYPSTSGNYHNLNGDYVKDGDFAIRVAYDRTKTLVVNTTIDCRSTASDKVLSSFIYNPSNLTIMGNGTINIGFCLNTREVPTKNSVIHNAGTLTVKGNVTLTTENTLQYSNGHAIHNDGTATIEGGTFVGLCNMPDSYGDNQVDDTAVAVINSTHGTMTIKDGIFRASTLRTGETAHGLYSVNTNVSISGGTFNGIESNTTSSAEETDEPISKFLADNYRYLKVADNSVFNGSTVSETGEALYVAPTGSVKHSITVSYGSASHTKAFAGTMVTLTANAAPDGMVFDKWKVISGGVTIEDNKFEMPNADVEIEAVYKEKSVTITGTACPAEGGTVTGSGEYTISQQVFLTAIPNTGYKFVRWEENGIEVSDLQTYSFDVTPSTTDRNLVAVFEVDSTAPQPTTINQANADVDAPVAGEHPDFTATSDESEKYTVEVVSWYSYNESKILSADDTFVEGYRYELRVTFTPQNGYAFHSETVFTINNSGTYSYSTAPGYRSIDLYATGSGTTPEPELTEKPVITYDEDTFTVTATGDGTVILYVDGVEVENPYTFEQGNEAATYTVTATAQEEGKEVSETATKSVTVPAVQPTEYDITVTGGTASANKAVAGTSVTITANAAESGKQFKEWTGTDGLTFIDGTSKTSATAKFTMPAGNVNVTATYEDIPPVEPTKYTVTVINGTSDKATAAAGDTVTITAAAAPDGKVFDKWVVTGVSVADATAATTTFTMPASNVTAEATYKNAPVIPVTFTITFDANGGTGTMAPRTVESGTMFTLPANGFTAPYGKVFQAWYVGGNLLAPGAKITVTDNTTVKAIWEDDNSFMDDWYWALIMLHSQKFDITATASEGGEIDPAGVTKVQYSKNITYTITPDAGYAIKAVFVDGKDVGAVSEYTFKNVTKKHTIHALFEQINPYTDVRVGDWFYDDVLYVTAIGLMEGTGNGKFSPEITTDRAMLVTVLWRLEGCPVVDSSVDFDDVADGLWYSDAIDWASANGIVNGYGDGKFGPNDQITREQIMAILNRYAAYKNWTDGTALPMLAQYKCSEWAEDNVIWADMNGLLNGLGVDITDMTAKASRAELAAYLARFMQNIVK